MLNENTGIGIKKKNRLKKNAVIEAEQKAALEDKSLVKQEVEVKTKKDEEDDQMQIDTVNHGQEKQRNNYKEDLRKDLLREKYDKSENYEKQRMAVEIFGDSDDEDVERAPAIKDGGVNNAAAE